MDGEARLNTVQIINVNDRVEQLPFVWRGGEGGILPRPFTRATEAGMQGVGSGYESNSFLLSPYGISALTSPRFASESRACCSQRSQGEFSP